MKSTFITIFIAAFYVIGAGLLGFAIWSARRSSMAANWPTARGQIDACTLDSRSGSEGGMVYEVKVRYTYTVQHKHLTGTRVAFGYSASSGADAHQQIFVTLQQAKSIDVRYNPSDPSQSTLSFGIHRSIQFMFAFSITWLLFVTGFSAILWLASRSDTVLLQNLSVH